MQHPRTSKNMFLKIFARTAMRVFAHALPEIQCTAVLMHAIKEGVLVVASDKSVVIKRLHPRAPIQFVLEC